MSPFIAEITNSNLHHFEEIALGLFQRQADLNPVLSAFCRHLNRTTNPQSINEITFLPVSFFKTKKVVTGKFVPETVFASSATTGSAVSKHFIRSLDDYAAVSRRAFEMNYGSLKDTCILALLPSYLERSGSSLVWMAQQFMTLAEHPKSGFFLYDFEQLHQTLTELQRSGQKTILLGVTYALLDFVGHFPIRFPELTVMETGGMKGRKREMVREEVHRLLCSGFGVDQIHSEYGMTEMLSQAYAQKDGIFTAPPWVQIRLADPTDPFSIVSTGKTGVVQVIDLANADSCAFIQTADLGRMLPDGRFEVLGRLDNSEVRGCSLMYF